MDEQSVVAAYADSEFMLLPENAEEAGLPWRPPPIERLELDETSALRWGTGPVDLVFLHGGGQNAHTWDTVLLALLAKRPVSALAVDLPGHGHSGWREDRDYSPQTNAATLAPLLESVAPDPTAVIGMSLGGLTTLALDPLGYSGRNRMLVDVTPATGKRAEEMTKAQRGATDLIRGPHRYASFEEMLDATAAASPTRSRASLRRGILHNARVTDEGWEWRYDSLQPRDGADWSSNIDALWDVVDASSVPTMLVRGANSFHTTDADMDEFRRRSPGAALETVPDAGHSIQGDQPLRLAGLIAQRIWGD
ncbi:alpha/beta hydrolase [Aldersonia sp. NBC_00410]|uniref:alpha/beta fold hydrolase n=1 Tax=Aldersonia sp. NBC_00410 TaxID=2975954 RepID=UPI00224E4C81|nr:alpha/beta hydrolase [Aldersonia sp. NBC_00410]MCX5045773.1 alpha/beta hydrolase [Aldersonia sp. NBC_00410]